MKKGFTLIEAIITITIVGLLALMAYLYLKPSWQIAKAQDSQRKADLNKISKSIEDYLNDNPCYPVESTFDDCGGEGFKPYLREIPCDPRTKQPYVYIRPECQRYAVFASLETENLDITFGANTGNYGVSSQDFRLEPTIVEEGAGGGEAEPTNTPAPTPTPNLGVYFGCFSGECQELSGPECEPNYLDSDCYNSCGNPISPLNECQ